MKNVNLLFNPFTRIAGWQALVLGLTIAVLSGIIGTYGNVVFDGALDAHIVESVNFKTSFLLLAINIVSISAVMYAVALIIAKGTRFVDILGTMTLARAPYLVTAILGLFVTPIPTMTLIENPMIILTQPMYLLFSLLALPIIFWMIALMFNAFKVSTGAKGGKLIAGFIIGLIVAEVVSKVVIYLMH